MLLALDVGNTNIVIGFLDESGIRNIARLETDRDKTAHEYAISLRQVIEFSGIAPEDIDGAILSSVVPPINGALIAAVRMITGIRPLVVGPGMKTGLNIALDNPATMGSDLVVGAAAALAIHAPPLIIIDMGTATTMTVIDREARVLGGAIIPGVGISLEALASGTSQLPHISLDAPKKCITFRSSSKSEPWAPWPFSLVWMPWSVAHTTRESSVSQLSSAAVHSRSKAAMWFFSAWRDSSDSGKVRCITSSYS